MLIDGLKEMTRLMWRRVRQIRGEPVVVCEVSVIAKDVRAAGPVGRRGGARVLPVET
jgi:hypothetical protein